MFPRYRDTRGMDHMRLHPARPQPARQPEAVPTSFEGQCNPRDLVAGLDRLVAPAMQQAKQPFWGRLQLLARLALNAGKHTGDQPTRLAHLDDGNDRAILVQGDEGPAQSLPQRRPRSFGWGIRALHQLATATMVPFPRRLPHSISPLEEAGFEPSVPLCLGAFTRSKTSVSGPVDVGGFEKREFEGDSATEKVAAQIGLR